MRAWAARGLWGLLALCCSVQAADFLGDAHSATELAFVGEGKLSQSLDEAIAVRAKFLTEYQNAADPRVYG